MKTALWHAGRAAAGPLPAAALARLGMLATLAFLAVLILPAACWVISDDGRSKRVTQILSVMHDGIRSPDVRAISQLGSHRRHEKR